ncbi:MAG TPA: S8 family serine peptidase [Thermoanaerobaculia bacterium]|nr:S8 family serine peptidase [Thermoanaerobaculia bacterium]
MKRGWTLLGTLVLLAGTPAFASDARPPEEEAMQQITADAVDPHLGSQWAINFLHLTEAWQKVEGNAYVDVIDLGLEVNHEDLRAFPITGPKPGNFRLHLSYDLRLNHDDPCPDEFESSSDLSGPAPCDGTILQNPVGPGNDAIHAGHGTHVSGILAATPDNGLGITGACRHCSFLMSRIRTDQFDIPQALYWGVDRGSQILSGSFGIVDPAGTVSCPPPPGQSTIWNQLCESLALADQRDVVMVFAAGNNLGGLNFPARYQGAIAVGGVEQDRQVWRRDNDPGDVCPYGAGDSRECGSNFGPQLDLIAPAENIFSTVYTGKQWITDPKFSECGDGSVLDGYGYCTGTSMSTPFVAGIAGLVRSANPLLTKQNVYDILARSADRWPTRNDTEGYGVPNARTAVDLALGLAPGRLLTNRLTPLFSFYGSATEDHLYTTVPQVASSAVSGLLHGSCTSLSRQDCPATWVYQSTGPAVPGYASFPGVPPCNVSPCLADTPTASVYVFTSETIPYAGAPALVPLYRMTYKGTNPNGNQEHRDTTYTTSVDGLNAFHAVGYDLDGIEGYIFPRCTPEPGCMPAGTVRLYRRYHVQRDDFAIFPESELAQMVSQGYTSTGGTNLNEVIGYVYPNADADGDRLVNGFEGLIGTSASIADSDCDGLTDGTEALGYPYTDPLVANSGSGCALPKDARVLSQSVPATMAAGRVYAVSVTLKNAGTETWSPIGPQCGAYRLGSANPYNNGTWVPATRVELSAPVAPGQQVTLNFTVTAPSTPGTYNFQWRMVQECVTWFGDFTPNVAVSVQAAPPRDAQILSQNVPSAMVAGQSYPVSIRLRNVGSQSWSPIGAQCNGYRLGSVNPYDNTTWGSSRVELPAVVAPGGEVTLSFTVTAPATSGTYNFQRRMVQECVTWFGDFSPNVAVPVTVFADVPLDYGVRSFIETLYSNGITGGCALNPRQYCPDTPLTRAAAAVFLIKAKGPAGYTPPPATCNPLRFQDVPCTNPAAPYIEEFARRGITVGCGGGNYCPDSPVSRGTMAYFLLATLGISPPTSCTGIFSDVPCTEWYAPWVEELYRRGITAGCASGQYCPNDLTLRSQAAVFVVRTFNLP